MKILIAIIGIEHVLLALAFFNQHCLIKSLKICKKKLSTLCDQYRDESFAAEQRATKHFAKLQAIEKILNKTNDYTTLVYALKKILANPTIN